MRFSNLLRQRRKRLHEADKKIDETATSSFFSDLTKNMVNDRMRKERSIYTFDQEGNIKEIAQDSIKKIKKESKKKNLDINSLGIGYYLVTPVLIGVFLGLSVDYRFKTKPLFFILFLALGTLASFYNIFKLTKER